MSATCPLCNEPLEPDGLRDWLDCNRKTIIKNSNLSVKEYSEKNGKCEIFRLSTHVIWIDYEKNTTGIYSIYPHAIHPKELDCELEIELPGADLFPIKTIESLNQQLGILLTFS